MVLLIEEGPGGGYIQLHQIRGLLDQPNSTESSLEKVGEERQTIERDIRTAVPTMSGIVCIKLNSKHCEYMYQLIKEPNIR